MRHSALHSLACLFCCVSTALFANTQLQSASAQTKSQDTFPGETWQPRSSAETAKWSSDKLAAAHAYADSIHSSAVMIIQGGQVVDLLRARSGVYHPVDFETALIRKIARSAGVTPEEPSGITTIGILTLWGQSLRKRRG
jgi:hypothetical protein